MPQTKDKDWLNGYKKKTPTYVVYKRPTSKQGTHTDNIYRGSCFCIHSASLCLLVGAFNPFTFKVITDKYDPVAIYCIVLGSSLYTVFLSLVQRRSFSICWRAGLVVLNSLSFCLSEKLLISPSYLNEILAGYNNLDCRLFSFITLSMSCHSLLA